MHLKIFEQKINNVLSENLLLKFAVIGIVISQVALGAQVTKALTSQRTILVPHNLDQRVTITGGEVSDEYVKIFARNISTLAFNYTPATARAQFSELLQYYTPEAYPAAQGMWSSLADTIERTQTSATLQISGGMVVNPKAKTIHLSGVQRVWSGSHSLDNKVRDYVMKYTVKDGRFYLIAIGDEVKNTAIIKPEVVKERKVISAE